MKRPPTIRTLRLIFSDEPYAAMLVAMINKTRKSRKRKEYLRALIRLNTPPSESDFIYFTAMTAATQLYRRFI